MGWSGFRQLSPVAVSGGSDSLNRYRDSCEEVSKSSELSLIASMLLERPRRDFDHIGAIAVA